MLKLRSLTNVPRQENARFLVKFLHNELYSQRTTSIARNFQTFRRTETKRCGRGERKDRVNSKGRRKNDILKRKPNIDHQQSVIDLLLPRKEVLVERPNLEKFEEESESSTPVLSMSIASCSKKLRRFSEYFSES